jgi:hypothetical protein
VQAETHNFVFPNTGVGTGAGYVWQKISDIPNDSAPFESTKLAVGNLGAGETGWMVWQQWNFSAPGGTWYWRGCYDPGALGGTTYCGPEQTFTMPNPAGGTLPDTSILTKPPSSTSAKTAAFTIASPLANATFECKLDGAAFTGCADGVKILPGPSYSNLAVGGHTFQARAKNATGQVDSTPASYAWTVTAAPPPPPPPVGPPPPPPPPPVGPPPPPPPPPVGPPPPPPPPGSVKCVVPNVVGKKLAAAKAALTKAHCATGTVTKKRSAKKVGTVIAQTPRPGARLPRGTKVKLTLSRGRH